MRTTLATLTLLLLAPSLGCHTGSSSTAAGAIVMTSLAGGASAYKRSTGDCYVDCLPGTRCNRQSGLCETLPCRDKCGPNETCEESLGGIKCIPASGLAVSSKKGDEATAAGAPPKAGQPIEQGQTAGSGLSAERASPKVKDAPTSNPGPAQPSWRTNPNEADAPAAMDNPSLPPPK